MRLFLLLAPIMKENQIHLLMFISIVQILDKPPFRPRKSKAELKLHNQSDRDTSKIIDIRCPSPDEEIIFRFSYE